MKLKTYYVFLCILTSLLSLNTVYSVTTPITMTDIAGLNQINEYVSSSDGLFAAYTISTWQSEGTSSTFSYIKGINVFNNSDVFDITTQNLQNYENNLVIAQFHDTDQKPIDILFFLRNGQIYYRRFTKTYVDAKPLTLPLSINSFKVKGSTLAFACNVYPEYGDNLSLTVQKDADEAKKGNNTFHVYDKLPVRLLNNWYVGKVQQVFTQGFSYDNVNDVINLIGSAVNRLNYNNDNVNNKTYYIETFGEQVNMYDLNPSGTELAVTLVDDNLADLKDNVHDELLKRFKNWQLYIIDLTSNNSQLIQVSNDLSSKLHSPQYSPNGNTILFLSGSKPDSDTQLFSLRAYKYGVISDFPDLNRAILNFSWFNDYTVTLLAVEDGYSKFAYLRLDLPNQTPLIIHDTNNLFSNNVKFVRVNNSNLILTCRSSLNATPEVYVFPMKFYTGINNDFPRYTQLTSVNSIGFNSKLGAFESFTYKNSSNEDIQGFLVKPVDFDETKFYPLVLQIHGGPNLAFMNRWEFLFINPQLSTKNSFVVLLINPHGSIGKDRDFAESVRNNWGGKPYSDIMDGVKFILNSKPYIDKNKKCVGGVSYGGYMVNYIRGKMKDYKDFSPFNCYISLDGVFDTRSDTYSNDTPWYSLMTFCDVKDNGCRPYDANFANNYDKFSPEPLIKNWDNAPHFVVHGQRDYRIAWSQGNALFTALQLKKIKSKYMFLYEESHVAFRMENQIALDSALYSFVQENIAAKVK